jgi:hypothetical protein
MILDKFIPPFIRFINENFNPNNHLFVIIGKPKSDYGMDLNIDNVFWLDRKLKIVEFEKYLYKAEKIILHGLWDERILKLLAVQPWLLKKSYWIMWGGDFYFPEEQSFTKKMVIKNIRHIITYCNDDVEYIRKSYGANPIHHRCFSYLSNVFDENKYEGCKRANKHDIWILVGNSATETNRHELVFDKLKRFKDDNIRLIVPLSYGNDEYRKRIFEVGRREFSNKFYPIVEFLPFEQYLNIIFNIDIAIFFHNRSQAMGNIIQILGLGKKIFLDRNNNPLYQLFRNLGVKVYDFETEFNLIANEKELISNSEIIKKTFSLEQLKLQLDNIFYGRNK